jgi:hypothetical protein
MASSRDPDGPTLGATSSTRKTASLQGLITKGKTLKRPREGDDDNDKCAIHLEPRRPKDNKENSPVNARDFFAKYNRADSNPRPNYLAGRSRVFLKQQIIIFTHGHPMSLTIIPHQKQHASTTPPPPPQ